MNKKKITFSIILLVSSIFIVTELLVNNTRDNESDNTVTSKYLLSESTLNQLREVKATIAEVDSLYGPPANIREENGYVTRSYFLVSRFPELLNSEGVVGFSIDFRSGVISRWDPILH